MSSFTPKAVNGVSGDTSAIECLDFDLKREKKSLRGRLIPDMTDVDRQLFGRAGSLESRIYTPLGAGAFPVLVYFNTGKS